MECNIAVIEGDGIGPEIIKSAVEVLDTIAKKYGHKFHYDWLLAGGASIDKYGVPLTDETLNMCFNSDAVLLGAVGGPKWEKLAGNKRPETALLKIRKELNLYANLRPARLLQQLKNACPLKAETAEKGFDIMIVRELTGGIYYGERKRWNTESGEMAYDTESYSEAEIVRIGKIAFDLAKKRSGKLCSIDKANVLDTSRLWRDVMHRLAAENPDVQYSDMLVDNCAMQLIKNPAQFDVIVTSNMFGDILSDEASQLTGSIGLLPSASIGSKTAMYEPIHGSAPDIAGLDIANPIATILSVAMMLKYTFSLHKEATDIELAVDRALSKGFRTMDIAEQGIKSISCSQMTKCIVNEI